ncbi:MAG: DUF3800 domain-containing protein [Nitrospirae bacterium]|nr:DUF3800 domain-containing protein [Nitrospirota bacterium]
MDDSGDPGFKVSKGSSNTFVIGMVVFDDPLEAEETALRIKKLRRELRLSDTFEFKFNKCRKDFRCRFLETVKGAHFRARAIVMQKNRIYGKELRASKESFYNYAIKTVLKYHGGTINNARLRIDGRGDRNFKRALSSYLKRELNLHKAVNDKVIHDLRFVDSKRNVLIQLADMVTGAINRKYSSDKADSSVYIDIISNRIEDIWEFGR